MPYSGSQMKTSSGAVVPVAWYLLNLLLLPFVGFAALLWVYLRSENASSLRKLHAKAAVCMSLLGAALIGAAWLCSGWYSATPVTSGSVLLSGPSFCTLRLYFGE